MERLLRTMIASTALLVGACSELVSLGSECEHRDGFCRDPYDGGFPLDGSSSVPGRTGEIDGGGAIVVQDEPLDGGDEAPPPFTRLAVRNPGFERSPGLDGDVLLRNLWPQFLNVVPNYAFIELPDWFTCIPFSVTSLTSSEPVDAGTPPEDAGHYLLFLVNGTTVRQALSKPLEVGVTYAFQAKVVSHSEGPQNLFVQVSGAQVSGTVDMCTPGTPIGRSPTLKDSETWTTTCFTFTADKPYTHLLLAPAYEGTAPPLTASLQLDDLQQVASCDSLH